jgi:hypothetical protein
MSVPAMSAGSAPADGLVTALILLRILEVVERMGSHCVGGTRTSARNKRTFQTLESGHLKRSPCVRFFLERSDNHPISILL